MFVKVFHEFDWKTLNPQALEQVIDMSGRGVECLAYLSIEITMTDRLALRDERFGEMLKKITPHRRIPFTEGAFRPKTYTIRVERGAFDIPWLVDYGDAESRRLCPQYSLRLVFDLSPYPASRVWKVACRRPCYRGALSYNRILPTAKRSSWSSRDHLWEENHGYAQSEWGSPRSSCL